MTTNTPNIFISYAHEDGEALARSINEELRTVAVGDVFLDVESIRCGEDWYEVIHDRLRKTTHLIFILTPASVESSWCLVEWNIAVSHGISIHPVYYKNCKLDVIFGKKQYIDFRDPVKFGTKMNLLIDSINGNPDRTMHKTLAPSAIMSKPSARSSRWSADPIKNYAVHVCQKDVVIHCIEPDATVADAQEIIRNNEFRFRHLLVTPSGQPRDRLAGIISLRTILKVGARWLANPSEELPIDLVKVKDVMDRCTSYGTTVYGPEPRTVDDPSFVALDENATIKDALQAFITFLNHARTSGAHYYMSAIPLIDANWNAVGIIGFKDILKMISSGDLPLPDGTVGHYMAQWANKEIVVGLSHTTVTGIRPMIGRLGQRDVPVVNNYTSMQLQGLIPDHIMIDNRFKKPSPPLENILVEWQRLRLQTPDRMLSEMFMQYIREDIATVFYSFPVVDKIVEGRSTPPRLVGLISYRDLFRALLDSLPDVKTTSAAAR